MIFIVYLGIETVKNGERFFQVFYITSFRLNFFPITLFHLIKTSLIKPQIISKITFISFQDNHLIFLIYLKHFLFQVSSNF